MYFGGDVYSSVDPFATALGCTDGKVSFIGSDEAAKALDPDAIDLAGDLLAPGFVHAGLVLDGTAPRAAQLHEQGFTHAHVIGTAEAIAEFADRGLEVEARSFVGGHEYLWWRDLLLGRLGEALGHGAPASQSE